MDSLMGKSLSHFRVVERIGSGGMGVVYRAHDEVLRRDVALKVLPPSIAQDPDRLRRFEQEARAAGALNHPNILAIYDFGRHEGSPYVVTELLEGRTLRDQMAGRPLAVRKAVEYGAQIARGLAAAHEKGIVHRDVKPENLFVTNDGRVKILDFGIAKLLAPARSETGREEIGRDETSTSSHTGAGVILGTTSYMSPEQIRGEAVDHRSDLFALGTVLYEMLSGRHPFPGATPADTMSAILTHDPPSLTTLRDGVSPDLDRAVRRCLEKSARERSQSAWDLASELDRLAGAVPPTGRARGRGWVVPVAVGVAVAGLLGIVALTDVGGWRSRLQDGAPTSATRSLAVLPLQNLSADPEQEYFVDGLTEELITTLSHVGSLKVISRTSSMKYKGTKKTLPEIARELGVDAVIEGSVLRAGERVRVTAQLIRAATDEHLWAQSYERDLRDVLALQSGVAHLIAGEVAKLISPRGATTGLVADRPVDPAAHEDYLMGRFFWNTRSPEGLTKAIGYFSRCVEKDSTYAPAHSAIADYYNVLPFYTRIPPRDAFPKAKAAALRALAIDESLGTAHAALAFEMAYYEWDWAGAEREFQRALALTPSDARVHHSYSRYLVSTGRSEEGMRELKRAQELDPLSTGLKANEGMALFFDGKYDEAMAQLRKVIELDPEHPVAHWGLGLALEQKGMYPEAVAQMQRVNDPKEPDPNFMASLGHVYAAQGKREQAQRLIDRLMEESKKTYVSSYHAAVVYAGLGDKDRAFEMLNEAAEERSTLLVYLRKDPRLGNLRSDPRFQKMLNRIGLPW